GDHAGVGDDRVEALHRLLPLGPGEPHLPRVHHVLHHGEDHEIVLAVAVQVPGDALFLRPEAGRLLLRGGGCGPGPGVPAGGRTRGGRRRPAPGRGGVDRAVAERAQDEQGGGGGPGRDERPPAEGHQEPFQRGTGVEDAQRSPRVVPAGVVRDMPFTPWTVAGGWHSVTGSRPRPRAGSPRAPGDGRGRERGAMGVDPDDISSNPSANRPFHEVVAARLSRRSVLRGGAAAVAGLVGAGVLGGTASADGAGGGERKLLGFPPVTATDEDALAVPDRYTAQVLIPWGTPLLSDGPEWRKDASNSAADAERQVGSHHDGMHYFPLGKGKDGSRRGVLVLNHEYMDRTLSYPDGDEEMTRE